MLAPWPSVSLGLAGFVWRERPHGTPMLPLGIFRSRLFSATNVVTFAVYAALGGVFLFLVLDAADRRRLLAARRPGSRCCR